MPIQNLDLPLSNLRGVGDILQKKLSTLGVNSIIDLLTYYPKRYEDYSNLSSINNLRPGLVSVKAEIKQVTGRYVRRGLHITEAIASDSSGSVRLIWFNQPYRASSINKGHDYYISGVYELRRQKFSILNPSMELSSDLPINTAKILAIYKETKGLKSRQIRLLVNQALELLSSDESLPKWLIDSNKLITFKESISKIHQPVDQNDIQRARLRLGFEEVFCLSLASLLNKQEISSETATKVKFNAKLAQDFVKHLPYKLTDAQKQVAWKIFLDLEKSMPMNRLVEGDVGSGKTVIAAMAAAMTMSNNMKVALMAPTEILATQHVKTIHNLLKPINMHNNVTLLVGGLNKKQKINAYKDLKSGQRSFVIGTQALIQDKVAVKNLALIIVDEQHRFGVDQRKSLMSKAGHMPHVLSLSATPIPRSLALTLYGELDISILHEKPAGRNEIETKLVYPNSKAEVYKQIDHEIQKGRLVFVVCPMINDSGAIDASSVIKVYETLQSSVLSHRRVGLLHGKLKSDDKQLIMKQFIDKDLDILVSTTVIEVGVDVPNASIIMIESPERFGLAQLHQLRGRVGRGKHRGFCYLMLSDSLSPSRRLRALESSNDGFMLAELDLEIRGPGAIYGTSQHGQLDLRIAKLTDTKLIADARNGAREFIKRKEDLLEYKELAKRVNKLRTVTNLN